MTARSRLMSAVLLLTLFALSRPARAGAAEAAAAQSLFDEGRQLLDAGKPALACPKLEESNRLAPAPGTQFHLARCYESIGRTASAWALFLEVAATARSAGKGAEEQAARDRAKKLAPTLAHLVVAVAPERQVDGFTITYDGKALRKGLWGNSFAVDPGEHHLVARAPEHTDWRKTVVVSPGRAATVVVPALRAIKTVPDPDPFPPPEHDRSSSGSSTRTLGYVTAGAGVVALGLGSYFGLRAFSKWDDRNQHCPEDRCDAAAVDLGNDASTAATISSISFGAGALLGGLAVYWIATAGDGQHAHRDRRKSFAVQPVVAPTGGGVAVSRSW